MLFLSLKVLHIVAVIAWMAGLFYLPRLFVYHVDEVIGSTGDVKFQIMERRLMAAIMRPACVVALLAGVGLVLSGGFDWGSHWLSAKLLAVVLLVGFHGILEKHLREFRLGLSINSARYFRIINEVPTVLLIFIVAMVVIKPF